MSLSIRTRLYGGFTILLTFLLVSFLVAATMLRYLNGRVNDLVEHDVEKVRMAGVLDHSVQEIARLEQNIILSDNPEEMAHFTREITLAHVRLQQALKILDTLAHSDPEKRVLMQIAEAIAALVTMDREMRRLGMLNSNVRAAHLSEHAGQAAMFQATAALEKIMRRYLEGWQVKSWGQARHQFWITTIIQKMQRLLLTIHNDEIRMILSTDEARMGRYARDMERNTVVLIKLLRQLEHGVRLGEDSVTIGEFRRYMNRYLEISRQVRSLTLENGNYKATRFFQERGQPILLGLRDSLQVLSTNSEQRMLEAKKQSEKHFFLAFGILLVMLCLSFIAGIMIAVRISRDVNRGLSRAIQTVEAVACGDFCSETIVDSEITQDEFGQLMRSLGRLVDAENRVADLVQRLAQDDWVVTVVARSPHDRLLIAVKHLAGALRERNELRRMLLVSEKMSSIGQFAVRVAHEINNPLATAMMGLQNIRFLLAPDNLVDGVQDRLNQVERHIERATRVARQMLEYSWTGQPEITTFDLREELKEVLDLMQADARPMDIILDIGGPLPVRGDREKIGQVFRNLIQNSMDATPDHGLIRVGACCEGGMLQAEVRDYGPGMAEDVAQRIFDPFFTTKKSGIGVGLGLPICTSIVRQHGGTLDVVNAVDGGVLATLRLPITHE
ncbi:MAG: MCP four helix bundle domain-containing protein [Nitrospirae bacterium]|nr:MCP four helix bundle domain-containing protein [Magnetococcales bacterium]HAT50032.1 hypothetical protein [Alphaproteobacteria bacterium]